MKLIATLKKPYTDFEYADFIVEHNHKHNRTIKETDTTVESWGYTEEEQAAIDYDNKCAEVRSKRDALLEESDIYMLVDKYNSLTSEQQKTISTYRIDLRDIPEQSRFPYDVVFPTKPEWIKSNESTSIYN